MDSNPNLSLLMDKLFDNEEIMDRIMKTDDMTELYDLCQMVQGGYTFEEFLDFFESLVCICLDEAKDLKDFMEKNADKAGKLSEKELKDISGGVNGAQKLTASVLASLMFLTGAGVRPAYAEGNARSVNNVPLRDAKPGEEPSADDINKILIDISKEKPNLEPTTGQKIANWFNKAADYVWDHKGAFLGSAVALAGVGGLLVYDSNKIGESFERLAKRHNDIEKYNKQLDFLSNLPSNRPDHLLALDAQGNILNDVHGNPMLDPESLWQGDLWDEYHGVDPQGKAAIRSRIEAEKTRLENQGIIKTLTNGLIVGSAVVTVLGAVGKGLSELTSFVSKFAQAATDINTLQYYYHEAQKNVASWRNTLNIELQKQEAKNYDADREEDRLRYMFDHFIHGQQDAKNQIMSFFTQFSGELAAAKMGALTADLPAPRVLIFNGPSGTGKTFMAELLSAGLTSIDPYIITASDILKSSKGNPASMPYAFLYGNTQNGGNSKDDTSKKNNLISFLKATEGSVRVIVVDEWDKIYRKDVSTGVYPATSPLEETLRDIIDNRLTDYNGMPVDLNGAVFIFTTNETNASLQGRIRLNSVIKREGGFDQTFEEALVDENGDPMLDGAEEQIYGKPKMDSSRTQTLVPHDGSLMARLSGSICCFDKLSADDCELIARDALGDDRSIKTVDDYIKSSKLRKVSLLKRVILGIGGVVITDKGYRMIAEYASKMPNAARSIVGAGGNTTGSVVGNLGTDIDNYISYLKEKDKSKNGLVLLADPYEVKDSTGRKTIKFKISPLGYEDEKHTYEQYLEKCNKGK